MGIQITLFNRGNIPVLRKQPDIYKSLFSTAGRENDKLLFRLNLKKKSELETQPVHL